MIPVVMRKADMCGFLIYCCIFGSPLLIFSILLVLSDLELSFSIIQELRGLITTAVFIAVIMSPTYFISSLFASKLFKLLTHIIVWTVYVTVGVLVFHSLGAVSMATVEGVADYSPLSIQGTLEIVLYSQIVIVPLSFLAIFICGKISRKTRDA